MHAALENAARALGLALPNLEEAAAFSNRVLAQIQTELHKALPLLDEECLDVIVFGSLARREATTKSDLDFAIAVHRLPDQVLRTRELLDAVVEVQRKLSFEEPGRSGMFGAIMSAADITERIGLEQDTNLNHSRRILLFQESTSVFAPELHERLLAATLERYVIDYATPKRGVARFLLNDLLRYWRTIAVDYQAKRWEAQGPTWGLRYIKLKTSRKLAYAGTLASLLRARESSVDYFIEQFRMPALARLAQLEPDLEDARKADLALVLTIADEVVGHLKDGTSEGFAIRSGPKSRARASGESGAHLLRICTPAQKLHQVSQFLEREGRYEPCTDREGPFSSLLPA